MAASILLLARDARAVDPPRRTATCEVITALSTKKLAEAQQEWIQARLDEGKENIVVAPGQTLCAW
ncbi:MAG: hypothetical protein H6734_23905 [Alphaproteobacteria bacterium]|nr:hypothetical protein [Alphaproteobacteria bacterium]